MRTKAVFRAAQALNDAGIRALRFNFRGVGTSTGNWDEGVGEKEDVRTALDWLARETPGLPLIVGGFSFGSRMGLEVGVEDRRVRALLGLGMPVDMYEYDFLAGAGKPLLAVQGADDEFGPEDRFLSAMSALGEDVTTAIVPGSGHYFHDHFDELKEAIRDFFTSGPGASALAEDA